MLTLFSGSADRTYRGYKLLLRLVPSLKLLLEDSSVDNEDLDKYITLVFLFSHSTTFSTTYLQSSRREQMTLEATTLGASKRSLAIGWMLIFLRLCLLPPGLVWAVVSRMIFAAGFFLLLTIVGMMNSKSSQAARLLSSQLIPPRVCSDIRAGVLDISENYFLGCLYPKAQGNPELVEIFFCEVDCLSRYWYFAFTCFLFLILLPFRPFVHSSRLQLPLNLLKLRPTKDLPARSIRPITRRKLQRLTLQHCYVWKVKWQQGL